jgi:hypothetical protein
VRNSCRTLLLGGWGLGLLLWLAGQLLSAGASPATQAQPVYFVFDYPPNPEQFVFRLDDPLKIEQARAILRGEQTARHVLGRILKTPASYNPPWSFHLDPGSIEFFHSAVEVCDASIQGVEQHLEEACGAFLPNCVWCPWGSRLLSELAPPAATETPTLPPTLPPSPRPKLYLPLLRASHQP